MALIFTLHLASTLFMTGVIWFVQIVHYPLFGGVGEADFAAYEGRHTWLTGLVVAPPMLIELATGAALVWRRPEGVPLQEVVIGLALLGVIWFSTYLLQIPRHTILSEGFDVAAHRELVLTNWLRTVAWSLRAGLVLWWTYRLI